MPRTDRSMRAMDGYSHRCDTGAYLDMRCILHTHTHTRRCASATKRAVDIQVEAHDPSLIGYQRIALEWVDGDARDRRVKGVRRYEHAGARIPHLDGVVPTSRPHADVVGKGAGGDVDGRQIQGVIRPRGIRGDRRAAPCQVGMLHQTRPAPHADARVLAGCDDRGRVTRPRNRRHRTVVRLE